MTDIALTLPARARTGATRRSGHVPASAAGGAMALLARAGRRALRRPLRTLVQLTAIGVGGLIIVNALALQTGRLPPLPAASGADMVSDRPPLPPVRPATLAPSAAAPVSTTAAAPAARPVAHEAAAAPAPRAAQTQAPASRHTDLIGELIRNGDLPPASIPQVRDPARDPARPVAAAQRALAKLGYLQSRADGVPGEATKAAIERFERDRKLPVTGQLNPRTLRELAAASGMKLD
jgi:hypothetical protein